LLDALPHAGDADAWRGAVAHAAACIVHFQGYVGRAANQPNTGRAAAGVAVNIAESLLHDAEKRCLHLLWQALQIRRNVKFHLDSEAKQKVK
jgi:hypothetical protein